MSEESTSTKEGFEAAARVGRRRGCVFCFCGGCGVFVLFFVSVGTGSESDAESLALASSLSDASASSSPSDSESPPSDSESCKCFCFFDFGTGFGFGFAFALEGTAAALGGPLAGVRAITLGAPAPTPVGGFAPTAAGVVSLGATTASGLRSPSPEPPSPSRYPVFGAAVAVGGVRTRATSTLSSFFDCFLSTTAHPGTMNPESVSPVRAIAWAE